MIKKPRGTKDWLFEEAEHLEVIRRIISNFAKKYNFKYIETPCYEQKQLFKRSVGAETDIVAKEMFEFIDKKNRLFVLRPESTAGVIRAVIENNLLFTSPLPLKLFYFGSMFRYERPQAGRLRQFLQFGIEVIGDKSVYQDLEVIDFGVRLLKLLDITDFELKINYMPSGDNRKKYITDLVNVMKNLPLCSDCQRRLQKNPLRILDCKVDVDNLKIAPNITNYLSTADKLNFQKLQSLLVHNQINFKVDNLLVRGLDYYTGLVFEINLLTTDSVTESTLVGGGHYDKLINTFDPKLNKDAIGFAVGIERLMLARSKFYNIKSKVDYMILPLVINFDIMTYAQQIANKIRENGNSVQIDFNSFKLKQKFRLSEKLNAQNLIIIGEQELNQQTFILKKQMDKEESIIHWSEFKNEKRNSKI